MSIAFRSTRDGCPSVDLSTALGRGLAPDGGLYVPEHLPRLHVGEAPAFPTVAFRTLEPFFAGDALAEALPALVAEAFDFPVPLVDLGRETALLELFHGPSAAFKDFGARFLAAALARMSPDRLTILVATSGDTGGAVAAAFHRRPGFEVVVLYPEGRVSARQAHQLGCYGDNVRAFAVQGVFDDCQRIVKAALGDPRWQATRRCSSANSINLGRLLPQVTYHAAASLWYRARHGVEPGLIVPSGNAGNATAALWARAMGFPIREIVLATNANRPLVQWRETGRYEPLPTRATLANAMDVGAPSNMERVLELAGPDVPVRALAVDDDTIRQVIRRGEADWGQVFCPHTACGIAAREALGGAHWIVAATAHPAKFETIVEPLIGHAVPLPPTLAALLARPARAEPLSPTLAALTEAVLGLAPPPVFG